MKIKLFAALAVVTLALAACGLRDTPAVPPAKGQVSPPAEPVED